MIQVETSDPGIVIRDLRKFFADSALGVGVAIYQRLTAPPDEGGTPVKTGHASSNWFLTEGHPYEGVAGSPADVDRTTQRSVLLNTVDGYKGGDLFIANNVGYIEDLNDGSSAQAPAGFVQAAVAQGTVDVIRGSGL